TQTRRLLPGAVQSPDAAVPGSESKAPCPSSPVRRRQPRCSNANLQPALATPPLRQIAANRLSAYNPAAHNDRPALSIHPVARPSPANLGGLSEPDHLLSAP